MTSVILLVFYQIVMLSFLIRKGYEMLFLYLYSTLSAHVDELNVVIQCTEYEPYIMCVIECSAVSIYLLILEK